MSGVEGANANDNTNDNGEMATAMVGTLVALTARFKPGRSMLKFWNIFCGESDHRRWKEAGNIVELSGHIV